MFQESHVTASVLFLRTDGSRLTHSRCWRVDLPGEEPYRTGAKRSYEQVIGTDAGVFEIRGTSEEERLR
ncbi:hypothetical protein F2P79_002546 [Pimephales promelas]|nr:hypothetical protein F2P79_002546 [Pimephales promelas]